MAEVFDEVGQHLADYYKTVRGYVRQEVTRYNLEPYLPEPPAKIADVGGGEGRDSEWLAERDYDVTLADPSFEQIRRAAGRDKRIHLMKVDDQSLLQAKGENYYDVVLSHGVLMYELHAPETHLEHLVQLLKPGGILSLLTKGYGGVEERLRRQGRTSELEDLQRTHQFRQQKDKLGQLVWAFDERELTHMIEDTGAHVLEWAGVRIVSDEDSRPLSAVRHNELNSIVAREIALSHDPAHRAAGQMLHFIAQK